MNRADEWQKCHKTSYISHKWKMQSEYVQIKDRYIAEQFSVIEKVTRDERRKGKVQSMQEE